jgi:membrane protease YdiL (CAAX protease family)
MLVSNFSRWVCALTPFCLITGSALFGSGLFQSGERNLGLAGAVLIGVGLTGVYLRLEQITTLLVRKQGEE